jgi:hypothetical protein
LLIPSAAKVQEAADSAVAIVEADAKEAHQQLTAVFDNVAKFGQEKKLAVEFKIRDVRNVSATHTRQY